MKAIVYENYGTPEVLKLTELKKPAPTDEQILVKIVAVSINGSDTESLSGKPLYNRIGGLRKPGNPILGSDIAGIVEAVGKKHREFKLGDEVFGELPGYHGGFAEYVCTHGRTLTLKPPSLTFGQAAAIPQGGVIALHGIRIKGRVQPGQEVLINGTGGSAGSFAVQLAKLAGAIVTGVDNPHKQSYMRTLGADYVIDYTRENFTKNGKRYDLILDLVANQSISAYQRALRPKGTYFYIGGSVAVLFQTLLFGSILKRATGKNLKLLAVPQSRKDLEAITELCVSGEIAPVIDRQFSFSEIPDAFRYINAGLAKGKVIIAVGDN